MATTFTLKRKIFANPAAITKTLGQAKSAGFTKSGFQWFGAGNLGSAISGTKTMVNKELLAQGNAAMKNATTEAAKAAAQKTIDSATTTVTLNKGQRAWEAAKGAGKLGVTAAVAGTALGAKKVDDAANGI